MKVEIVEAETVSELDRLVNSVIQDRKISDIKFTTTILADDKIKYTALIMIGD